ncbi:hypothetical protein EGW08_008773 [Elysia chlorotica]|uniref:C2H2-type domain-containing protein n=1 Tax=Elysia chlorotica TaxID=188477 RepID=A0A433TPG6_ELYCH|nr:hypothetical protein EGW08_008773 [Elysia chlorotica]
MPKLLQLLSMRDKKELPEEQCMHKEVSDLDKRVSINGSKKLPASISSASEPSTNPKLNSRRGRQIEKGIYNEEVVNAKNQGPSLVCPHCDKVYRTLAGYERHRARLKAHTSSATQGDFSEDLGHWIDLSTWRCSRCSKTFTGAAKIHHHIRLHCRVCPYVARSKTNIARHVRTHSQDRIFQCPLCDYKAVLKFSVTQHMLTHTKERPFPCNQCDYSARTSSQLASHKLRHSAGQQCYICGPTEESRRCRPNQPMNVPENITIDDTMCTVIENTAYHLDTLCKDYPGPNGYYFECVDKSNSEFS